MNKTLKFINDYFLDFLYPKHIKCVVCQRELAKRSRFDICDKCFAALPFNNQRQCEKCGAHINGINAVCNSCMKEEFYFDKALSVFIYEDSVQSLIYQLKFGNKKYLSEPLSQFLADKYIASNLDIDVVVCVPASKKSIKKRGYNQSYLLARDFCDTINKVFNSTDLVKIRDTHSQEGLDHKLRQENLNGAFEVTNKASFKGKNILIIDDVKTTGYTTNECAKILKQCHAKSVYVLTLASVREYIPFE